MTEAALQAAFEEGERGDWDAYVLRQPTDRRALDVRPLVAQLAGRIPGLELRAQVLAIDADPRAWMLAERAEALEKRGHDPYHMLVELFARKEQLARDAGFAGYAQLALAADGVTPEAVAVELALAEDVDGEADVRGDGPAVLDWFRTFFTPLLDDVEVRFEPHALVVGMEKVLRWPDHIAVVIRNRDDVHTLAHELGHALQCRVHARRGLGFVDWFALSCVEAETAAVLAERLFFERPAFERASLERARFELQAYASALEGSLGAGDWTRKGDGFWTEDPMRSYAYPLAYVRSELLYASLRRPFSVDAVVRLI
jgi:hypothetical protein